MSKITEGTKAFIDTAATGVWIHALCGGNIIDRYATMKKTCTLLAVEGHISVDLAAVLYVRAVRMTNRIESRTMPKTNRK